MYTPGGGHLCACLQAGSCLSHRSQAAGQATSGGWLLLTIQPDSVTGEVCIGCHTGLGVHLHGGGHGADSLLTDAHLLRTEGHTD